MKGIVMKRNLIFALLLLCSSGAFGESFHPGQVECLATSYFAKLRTFGEQIASARAACINDDLHSSQREIACEQLTELHYKQQRLENDWSNFMELYLVKERLWNSENTLMDPHLLIQDLSGGKKIAPACFN